MDDAPVLLWFRQDLRLADNPALEAVGARAVLPVFVLDDAAAGAWAYGGAARWWLGRSLALLGADLAGRGAKLLVRRGDAEAVIPALAAAIGAREVLAARAYEPWARARDERIARALAAEGRTLRRLPGTLLREPEAVRTGAGGAFSVYTPFSRAVVALGDPAPPLAPPDRLRPVADAPSESDPLDLYPVAGEPDWATAFDPFWTPGEAGAQQRLAAFLDQRLGRYHTARNIPGTDGSSRLSPHLRWGELSPRQVWHAALAAAEGDRAKAWPFLSEVVWREFSYHLLFHRPELPEAPLRAPYAAFPYEPDAALLNAWQRGATGYPLVDAGMRQLWQLGWMHNRVRMVTASLLVKHLLQPWQDGAAWFWDTLVDADLASNSASWQWVAGCGSDAAPYFRIFSPVLQGEKFDPDGAYVRRFVPELARLPDKFVHRPWEAPAAVLRAAGVALGETYPHPIIDHAAGRARALAALQRVTGPTR